MPQPVLPIDKSELRFLVDECCRRTLVVALREFGYDVSYVAEFAPSTADSNIADLAIRERRIIITDDRDFGEIAVRFRQPVPGVFLLRTQNIDGRFQAKLVQSLISAQGAEILRHFVVIEDTRYRIRKLIEL